MNWKNRRRWHRYPRYRPKWKFDRAAHEISIEKYDVTTFGDLCVDLLVSGRDATPEFGQVEKLVEDYRGKWVAPAASLPAKQPSSDDVGLLALKLA